MNRQKVPALLWASGILALALGPALATPAAAGVDEIAAALAAGEAAVARHDGDALMAAADALALTRARPVEGEADLVPAWRTLALQWGAKPTQPAVWRGRALGAGYRTITLPAHGTFHTRQVFVGGKKARVEMVATAASALSLVVQDDTSAPVCQREGVAAQFTCAWVPVFSLAHDITIASKAATPARLYLITD